jgi:opacity protein-like surface antigen
MRVLECAVVAALGLSFSSAANAAVQVFSSKADYLTASAGNHYFDFTQYDPGIGDDYATVANPFVRGPLTFASESYLAVYNDAPPGIYLGTSMAPLEIASKWGGSVGFIVGSYWGVTSIAVKVNGQSVGSIGPLDYGDTTFIGFVSDELIESVSFDGGPSTLDDVAIFGFWHSSAVPEPRTWAMMIIGFGMAGSGLRSRRPRAVCHA